MSQGSQGGFYRPPRWMVIVGWALAVLGGLTALGLNLPIFDLESRSHAATTYATKVQVQAVNDQMKSMSVTMREVRDNVIRLLERQGVQPVKRRR